MSVYYNVKEHISVKNYQDDCITSAIVDTIVSIGSQMLYDRATVAGISLNADGKQYFFEGREVTPKLHELIRAVESATTIDLVMQYDSVNCDFCIAEAVAEAYETDPKAADAVFYSLYNKADCNSGAGVLLAYGKKDGEFYNGPIEQKVSSFVEGIWYNEDTLVAFGGSTSEVLNLEDLKTCVTAFSALGADVDFRIEGDEITFYVNDMTIKTVAEFERFVDLCKEVQRLTHGDAGFILEFVDMSDAEAQVMIVDLDDNGTSTVGVASI